MNLVNKIKKNFILEIIKWCSVSLLFLCVVAIGYIFNNYDIYVRNIIVLCITLIALYIMFTTKLGKLAEIFIKESYVELQKVIWPTYQDSFNTTLVVVAVTIIVSLILWGLDTILVNLISFGLRL